MNFFGELFFCSGDPQGAPPPPLSRKRFAPPPPPDFGDGRFRSPQILGMSPGFWGSLWILGDANTNFLKSTDERKSLWNVFSQISTVGLKPVGRPGGIMWQPFTTPCTYICWGRPLRTRVSGGSNPPQQVPFFGRPIQYPCRVAGSGAGRGGRQGGASSSVADLRVELE